MPRDVAWGVAKDTETVAMLGAVAGSDPVGLWMRKARPHDTPARWLIAYPVPCATPTAAPGRHPSTDQPAELLRFPLHLDRRADRVSIARAGTVCSASARPSQSDPFLPFGLSEADVRGLP